MTLKFNFMFFWHLFIAYMSFSCLFDCYFALFLVRVLQRLTKRNFTIDFQRNIRRHNSTQFSNIDIHSQMIHNPPILHTNVTRIVFRFPSTAPLSEIFLRFPQNQTKQVQMKREKLNFSPFQYALKGENERKPQNWTISQHLMNFSGPFRFKLKVSNEFSLKTSFYNFLK